MNKTKRIYLKPGDIMGCVGYTDLMITECSKGQNYVLHSTEGGEYDFYDEETDTHHKVYMDMDGTPEGNKNFGKYFYEV